MRLPDKVISIVKAGVSTLRLNPSPPSTHWKSLCAFTLILLAFLHVPGTGRAEKNYFQIINGTRDAVSDDFIQDRGYTVYFNYDGKKFLLDTGNSEHSLIRNLKIAGVQTDELDFVAMSHSHKDHTSGWLYLRRQRPQLLIYIPTGRVFSYSAKFNVVSDDVKISPNIFLLYTHDESGSVGIKDELSLLINTKKGPFLFTTNSHTDFITKLEKAQSILGEAVFFHSGHTARRVTADSEILATAKKMKNLNVKQVSPSHSNPNHDKIFERVFGAGYVPAILGKKVPLEPVP
ncbi:MAG: MBL fold metallo-hydrolase [Gammaproteobacteria bacterium]|nr:MBL fold metallo-hydrolase [Gammaproteobacteria bacterium]